jgi:hypothetical protein
MPNEIPHARTDDLKLGQVAEVGNADGFAESRAFHFDAIEFLADFPTRDAPLVGGKAVDDRAAGDGGRLSHRKSSTKISQRNQLRSFNPSGS